MNIQWTAVAISALLTLAACSEPATPPETPKPAAVSTAATATPSFINKVWEVAESHQVEIGSLRTFLADGTLVMSSPNSTPAFGTWNHDGGRLTISEEGQKYDVEILELTEDRFRIRIHSPGEPVEIRFAPADQAALPLPPKAEAPAATARLEAVAAPLPALWGTAWRLEDLAGAGVVDRVQATLVFPSEGRASGNGSCNRFNGVVTIDGSSIQFGGIATTRKACVEAVMNQEEKYFAALRDAERFETDGQTLKMYVADKAEPLRFIASGAAAQTSGISVAPKGAASTPAVSGIWTIVAHHTPGISALSDDAARTRYGETVRLTASAATSPGGRCGEPGYTSNRVPADSYLVNEYKLPPGSVKPIPARAQFNVIEVSCGGAPWNAFGGRLLVFESDRALSPWDGVFFELKRDRDFRGVGQEPGWQLELRKGSEIRFTYDYGKGTAVTPAPRPSVDPGNGTQTYHAVSEANDLKVVIVPVSCADSMSGRPFPATVTVTLNGKAYRGCGEELATPYQG
jgi:heat shock protein HslJ/uncharacterized membrane protein